MRLNVIIAHTHTHTHTQLEHNRICIDKYRALPRGSRDENLWQRTTRIFLHFSQRH